MAVSALQLQKRKKLVYGKQGNRSKTTNVNDFFDEDVLSTSKPTVERHTTVKDNYPVQKTTEAKSNAPKPIRPRVKRQDTFDVPSSDDEVDSPAKIRSPPKITAKKVLYDDKSSRSAQLASWEQRRLVQSDEDASWRKRRTGVASPDAQLRQDLARATLSPEARQSAPFSPPNKSATPEKKVESMVSSPRRNLDNLSSAAARLAARRKEEPQPVPKRSILEAEDMDSTPRKRARTVASSRESSHDVAMADASFEPVCETLQSTETVQHGGDVYDFPDSSADESKPKLLESPKPVKKIARRGKLNTYSSRTTPRKGISAPARLSEMIATDTDTTEAPTRSPSSTSRRSTPYNPSTPPSGAARSPETAIKATGTMTPKQAQLWKNLLSSDPVAPSPSVLPIKDLTISEKRRSGLSSSNPKLMKSQSDVQRRRTRLVDRLKASAASSDESEEDDDSYEDISLKHPNEEPLPEQPVEESQKPAVASQSQSQTAPTGGPGPKITYSRIRSYLPEDSLEDDLMAGFGADLMPSQPGPTGRGGKSAFTAQKSAFDLEDSDNEESASGRIRTIHELRAAGRHIRGMEDIEELLSDIQNHAMSHQSRRRSALIDLASKLADKSFVARFVGHSFELQLAAECGASPDDIADFLLAAAVSLIVAAEPPEHTVKTLRDRGILRWLPQLLYKSTEVAKVAKDRRSNMSKASQGSLLDFTNVLKKHSALWEEEKPFEMTPRLIALKAMDSMVRSLRDLGDRSKLLDDANLRQNVLHDHEIVRNANLETALSVSILESLSTAGHTVNWPVDILSFVIELLPKLETSSSLAKRTLFLSLRLCLNLTNDNVRNCQLFGSSPQAQTFLLRTMEQVFQTLDSEQDDEKRTVALDLLILTEGMMINLTEHCDDVRKHVLTSPELFTAIVDIFQNGQKSMLEAESVEESISNVAFGYLAVILSNICQNNDAKNFVASKLPGKNLGLLVEAMDEFVLHHQKVDTMNFGGEEGGEVWSAFTEKLKAVLARLIEAEDGG